MLLEYLFDDNPYEGFPTGSFQLDRQGFNLPGRMLEDLIREARPARVIEVGTWKGNSAFYICDALSQAGISFELVCIDTWLGSEEMWLKEEQVIVPERKTGLMRQHGYPTIYYQFLANVIKLGYQHNIVPFPATSMIAYRVLTRLKYKANMVYIDGSHDVTDVFHDLENYWGLLEPGGILCGDDYRWFGVNKAVQHYVDLYSCEHGCVPEENAWWMRKPSSNEITQRDDPILLI